jgi:hypothetical protein
MMSYSVVLRSCKGTHNYGFVLMKLISKPDITLKHNKRNLRLINSLLMFCTKIIVSFAY